MKLNRSLSSSIIALLIITILISACAGATSAEVKPPAVQAVPTTAPAKPTDAPKPTEAPKPTDMPKPAFDLNAKVTDFVANLPDNFLGMKNTDALKALQSDPKPFLIDLREPKEITQTIESAVNIPVRSLLKNLDKLPAKDQAILVYCGIGHRGGIAVTLLQMLGYTNAKAIFGGLNSWKAAGLPIVDSAPIEPKASGAKVEVDQDLLAALDAWLGTMPDDFWGMPPTSASKTMATDPKPFVIDVREPQELKDSGYIDGSVNIPLRELFKDMGKLPTDKTAAIITYCAIGQRGSIALTALRLLGYTNVKSISGGLSNWVKAGLPVVGGKPAYDIKPMLDKFITNLPADFYGITNVDALKALQGTPKPFVIDVREAKEITQTIEGAVNIPIRSLTANLDKLPAKDQSILVYCGIGHRGGVAVMALQLLGYSNAKSIFGGFSGWKAAGLPIKDGGPVEPKASGVTVEVDKDLFAALDKFIASMPDDFYAGAPAAIAKKLTADPKPLLIDVREPQELKDNGYIDGMINIPMRDLFKNLDKLPTDKAGPIVDYCAIGHRGAMAMMALRLVGYTNVTSIGGGFTNWVKAGLPVKK